MFLTIAPWGAEILGISHTEREENAAAFAVDVVRAIVESRWLRLDPIPVADGVALHVVERDQPVDPNLLWTIAFAARQAAYEYGVTLGMPADAPKLPRLVREPRSKRVTVCVSDTTASVMVWDGSAAALLIAFEFARAMATSVGAPAATLAPIFDGHRWITTGAAPPSAALEHAGDLARSFGYEIDLVMDATGRECAPRRAE